MQFFKILRCAIQFSKFYGRFDAFSIALRRGLSCSIFRPGKWLDFLVPFGSSCFGEEKRDAASICFSVLIRSCRIESFAFFLPISFVAAFLFWTLLPPEGLTLSLEMLGKMSQVQPAFFHFGLVEPKLNWGSWCKFAPAHG